MLIKRFKKVVVLSYIMKSGRVRKAFFDKKFLINAIAALVVIFIIHYLYKAIDAPVTSYFLPVIFLLVMIYLEIPGK